MVSCNEERSRKSMLKLRSRFSIYGEILPRKCRILMIHLNARLADLGSPYHGKELSRALELLKMFADFHLSGHPTPFQNRYKDEKQHFGSLWQDLG